MTPDVCEMTFEHVPYPVCHKYIFRIPRTCIQDIELVHQHTYTTQRVDDAEVPQYKVCALEVQYKVCALCSILYTYRASCTAYGLCIWRRMHMVVYAYGVALPPLVYAYHVALPAYAYRVALPPLPPPPSQSCKHRTCLFYMPKDSFMCARDMMHWSSDSDIADGMKQ